MFIRNILTGSALPQLTLCPFLSFPWKLNEQRKLEQFVLINKSPPCQFSVGAVLMRQAYLSTWLLPFSLFASQTLILTASVAVHRKLCFASFIGFLVTQISFFFWAVPLVWYMGCPGWVDFPLRLISVTHLNHKHLEKVFECFVLLLIDAIWRLNSFLG